MLQKSVCTESKAKPPPTYLLVKRPQNLVMVTRRSLAGRPFAMANLLSRQLDQTYESTWHGKSSWTRATRSAIDASLVGNTVCHRVVTCVHLLRESFYRKIPTVFLQPNVEIMNRVFQLT